MDAVFSSPSQTDHRLKTGRNEKSCRSACADKSITYWGNRRRLHHLHDSRLTLSERWIYRPDNRTVWPSCRLSHCPQDIWRNKTHHVEEQTQSLEARRVLTPSQLLLLYLSIPQFIIRLLVKFWNSKVKTLLESVRSNPKL